MPRQPRKLSESGIYHIVFRGVNHCHLFEEQADFEKMLGILASVKEELALGVHAYCLMGNHAHLLLKEESPGDVVSAMRKLLGTYAFWFNRKYLRSGALLSNRYKSECVTSNEYLLAVVRYIHQNPVAAGMAAQPDAYRYSSYEDYCGKRQSFVDTGLILGMFSSEGRGALAGFKAFHEVPEERDCSLPDARKRSEAQVLQGIQEALGRLKPSSVAGLPKQERDAVLASLRQQGFTILQLERATGLSRGIIARCAEGSRATM